jgi:ribonuclease HI
VDGSYLGDSDRAGAGGLIRSGDGSWLIGFSCFLGKADNTYAELMALYHGLNLAMYNGYTYICCYSDSKSVIDLISKSIDRSHCYASVIENIKNLINLDLEVNLSHTLREGNASADFLAKLGSNNDSRMMIWKSPPEGLNNLLLSDSRRMLHPRP